MCVIPEELQLYKSDINLETMKTQLLMLLHLIRTRNMKLDNTVPIKKVTNIVTLCDKDMLSEVFRLLKIFLTVPVTTSTAERTFSYLRSTMAQARLNHVMLLYIHKDRTDQIDIERIAKDFILKNEQRRHYFDICRAPAGALQISGLQDCTPCMLLASVDLMSNLAPPSYRMFLRLCS